MAAFFNQKICLILHPKTIQMKGLVFIVSILIVMTAVAQSNHPSIHQEEWEKYKAIGLDGNDYEQMNEASPQLKSSRNCNVNKIVYGWHPFWSNGLQVNYDWDLLSHLSYFSYEVNASTGNANTTHNFASAQAVTDALNNGVKVHLCVTLFSDHATFFGNATSRQNLINNLITLVQNRGAHGVNIDFESMASSLSSDYTNFMVDLSTQMKAAIPGCEITVALHSVDWSGFYDMATLNNHIDYFMIMGYDYYWTGSTNAGPNDPLFHFGTTYNYNQSRSTTYYIDAGADPEKLVMGLPYYGREWPVSTFTTPAPTTGNGASRTYRTVKDNVSGFYTAGNKNFEPESRANYYNFTDGGTMKQCFISEENELRERMDFINKRGLAGMGIWALGYDDGYNQLWDAIADNFTNCAEDSCSANLYDIGGGPLKNYYNNEDYTFTLAPPNAQSIQVNFSSFDVEANYDYLYIYDGNSIAAPQISGSPFTGTNSPGSFTSSTGALTFRFVSDGATVAPGWNATYTCQTDNIPPTTVVDTPPNWVTEDFTIGFTDADNNGGSGIDKSFYQVIDFDGTEWRANATNGFFSDNFDQTAPHADWTSEVGTWQITNGYLHQNDEGEGNTNIHAALNQTLSNRYLYHWAGKITGAGSNRRAGFHFFCDDPTQTNRGNSYFVWFRLDDNKIQIYKVINNVFGAPVVDLPFNFTDNQWHDFKVTYDRIFGGMRVYIDNTLEAEWTDASPISSGNYISFRSGNADYMVNNLKVYRTRYPNVTVTVGAASINDIRFQNPSPTTPSGRVKSIVQDNVGNLSSIDFQDINVDWTAPLIDEVNDGLGADEDTLSLVQQTQANWSSNDPNSGVQNYYYALGSSPFSDDVVAWTSGGLNTSATVSNSGILQDTWYYFSLQSENGAGIKDSLASNGFRLLSLASIETNELIVPQVFPNPTTDRVQVQYSKGIKSVSVLNTKGQLIKVIKLNGDQNTQIDLTEWAIGTYFIEVSTVGGQKTEHRIVKY